MCHLKDSSLLLSIEVESSIIIEIMSNAYYYEKNIKNKGTR